MKLSVKRIDVSPKENIFLGGYVQRKTPMEGLHDPITATIMVLTINNEKTVWVTMDLAGTTTGMIDNILSQLYDKGIKLPKDHFVLCGTHTHSGPNFHNRPGMNNYTEKEEAYVKYLCSSISQAISETYNEEGTEVKTRYSEILIDGLYSNRNDKNKLSDKHDYMIGFFNNEDKLVAIYHLMAHHCTVLGPQNMLCSADLFGNLRPRLEEYFGCPVFMAQGNAGDMGNKQYRDGNDFAALDRQGANIAAQIFNKYSWKDINMDSYSHKDVLYHASFHVDYSIYKQKYIEFSERLKVATNVDDIKLLTGWVGNAERKRNLPPEDKEIDMPAEILNMGDVQIVLVPGELGSILGLRIKEASKAKLCFVWGYNQSGDLGYMIEKEAFATESQESQVTQYNPGIADEYVEEIIRNL